MRYIIDYYSNAHVQPGHEKAIEIHVRPAFDSMEAALDRARVRAAKIFGVPIVVDDAAAEKAVSERYTKPYEIAKPNPQDQVVDRSEFEYLASLTPEKVYIVSELYSIGCMWY